MKSKRLLPRMLLCLCAALPLAIGLSGCQSPSAGAEPVTDFTASVLSGNAPLTVQFSTPLPDKVARWWFFGDGYTSQELKPTHTYESDGVFTVSLVTFESGEPEAVTKDEYIRVGSQAPKWTLEVVELQVNQIDLPPNSVIASRKQFTAIDFAGEGIIYWTGYAVKDKNSSDWVTVEKYEHSIHVDEVELMGAVDAVAETWNFQGKRVGPPGAYYPAIYGREKDTTASALWRVQIPFHRSMTLSLENNDDWGTVFVHKAYVVFGAVTSGVRGKNSNIPRLGEMWSVATFSDKLAFPVAPKIKTILEDQFKKKVYSVTVVSHMDGDVKNYWLLVDAPEIPRDSIRDFLRTNGYITLTYKL